MLYVEIVPPFPREGNAIRSNQEECARCNEDNVQPTGGGIDATLAAGDINAVPISTTGDKSLFFNGTYVRGLKGDGINSPEDELNLLIWLHNWTTHVRFTFRHRWSNGDVVIWDNRSTQHVAINDYSGQHRELNRTTVAGKIPSS